MLDHPRIFFHQSVSEHNSVWLRVCACLHAWPSLLHLWKCNVWGCWSPGWQCIQQWKSEGLVLSPAYESTLPALQKPFICAQGLEMTKQPLLIAPDGTINKAMIHMGPVLTPFFTLQSLKPQGSSYLTPPLNSSSSSLYSLYHSSYQMLSDWPYSHTPNAKKYAIPYTAVPSWVNGL